MERGKQSQEKVTKLFLYFSKFGVMTLMCHLFYVDDLNCRTSPFSYFDQTAQISTFKQLCVFCVRGVW